jgi:hypothetical protein
MWRTTPLVPSITIAHHPEHCAACNTLLLMTSDNKPHIGYYVLELVHGGINNPPAVKPKLLGGLREICIKRRRGLFLA